MAAEAAARGEGHDDGYFPILEALRRLRNRVIMMLWMRMLLRQLVVRWWLRVHFRRFMWVWHLRVLRARVRLFLWRIRHDHLVYILDTIMVLAYVVFKINASFIGYIEFVKLNCSSAQHQFLMVFPLVFMLTVLGAFICTAVRTFMDAVIFSLPLQVSHYFLVPPQTFET
ncbi:uncharacterized protein LOC127753390 isoform X1 [Oryza glaberrima]|uniref:uncharacterized protein LOC127753390 isoform X1 n=1 Tax=Oryza glaberrima TaxID=4538 RepID=UPI00224C3DE9|nr:uncharacterized protein LOC127753390 isoform X1 [Oryza glaberrima]